MQDQSISNGNDQNIFSTSVLFIVFNRPETTKLVFESIKRMRPQKLYISSDGPRINREGEKLKVDLVRNLVTNIDWDCEVFTLFREENIGCKLAVSSAINWFFSHEEKGIILEDDCLPNLDFFNFCSRMLTAYENESKVMMITGNNFQNGQKRGDASYYFSKYNHIWGWATWRRAWEKYDLDISFWPKYKLSKSWVDLFPNKVERKYWEAIFNRTYNKEIDTWDYSWAASIWYNNGVTLTPNVNLISNIGFNRDATHTTSTNNKLANLPTVEIGEIKLVTDLRLYEEADKYIFDYVYDGNKLKFPYNYFSMIKRAMFKIYKTIR